MMFLKLDQRRYSKKKFHFPEGDTAPFNSEEIYLLSLRVTSHILRKLKILFPLEFPGHHIKEISKLVTNQELILVFSRIHIFLWHN